MVQRQLINIRNVSKASLLLSIALTALSGAMVGCSDDDSEQVGDGGEPAQSAGSSSGGTAGHSTGGTHTAGTHTGGTSADAGNGSAMGGMGGDAATEALAVEGDRRIPYTPTNDLEFAEFFIMHHQMAIAMGEHEVAHGSAADVKAIAQAVIDAQTAEVET